MSAQAFAPDFLFSQITKVNFGGDWFGVGVDGQLSGSDNDRPHPVRVLQISFPGFAGGTPGVVLDPSTLPPYPHAASAIDLSHNITTLAGKGLVGFGISIQRQPTLVQLQLSGVTTTGYNNGAEIYFQLPSKSPFKIIVSTTVDQVVSLITAFVVPGRNMTKGVALPPQPRLWKAGDLVIGSATRTFLIDPVKLTATMVG